MKLNIANFSQKRVSNNGRDQEGQERELELNQKGELQLPAELLQEMGVAPGTKMVVSQTPEGFLLRPADPPLTRVYVEPTNACNLNCRTCVRNSWNEPEGFMSMDDYRRLMAGLHDIDTLERVSFWGFGEPLMHPHIVEMVSQAKELGAQTEIITNALQLDGEKAQGLVEAGLDTLIVSVDGASTETYADIRPEADLDLIKRNLKQLRKIRRRYLSPRPEVGIQFVVMRENINELFSMRQLARSLGASFIFLTNVLPYTREMRDQILYWFSTTRSSTKPYKGMPEIYVPPIDTRSANVEPLLRLTGYNGSIYTPQFPFSKGEGHCRFVQQGSLVVAWDGEVSPCIALMHSYTCYVMEREKHFLRYTLGNVGQEDVRSIWQKEEFVQFRDKLQKFPFPPCTECGGCNLAETNEEDCYGNTFPVCGDCLWAKGVIQCP